MAIGEDALRTASIGAYNVAISADALHNLTTGSHNVAVGYDALYASTTPDDNTAVGYQAGYTATPANGNVTGQQNTWIGCQAGPGVTGQLTNAISIGYRALNTLSNQAVIGNASLTDVYLGSVTSVAALHCAAITSNGGLQTFGANDSGGAGFRQVLVPNV